MFMISEGLGLFLLVNGKSTQFATPQEFNKARESAPSIPTVVLPIPQAKQLLG
jgi:multisubunit Na+/H+ antiporter MnhC subunit